MKLQTKFIEKIKEINAKRYDEMLGALPPIKMTGNGFLVDEAYDYKNGRARYDLYIIENEKYFYCGLATISDFNLMLIPS